MKQFLILLLSLICILSLSACDGKSGKDFGQSEDLYRFEAIILEVHDAHFLVKPREDTQEARSADKIVVSTQNADSNVQWQVGDPVLITYDGIIMETYPAQLHQVYKIEKLTLSLTE